MSKESEFRKKLKQIAKEYHENRPEEKRDLDKVVSEMEANTLVGDELIWLN